MGDAYGGLSDHLPRKARKAVNEVVVAIETVKRLAADADYTSSEGELPLRSAIDSTERALALAKCIDEDSVSRVIAIAPVWSFIAALLSERNELERRIKEKIERSSKTESEKRDMMSAAEARIHVDYEKQMMDALGLIGNNLRDKQ